VSDGSLLSGMELVGNSFNGMFLYNNSELSGFSESFVFIVFLIKYVDIIK